jgi:hypothetical protein
MGREGWARGVRAREDDGGGGFPPRRRRRRSREAAGTYLQVSSGGFSERIERQNEDEQQDFSGHRIPCDVELQTWIFGSGLPRLKN